MSEQLETAVEEVAETVDEVAEAPVETTVETAASVQELIVADSVADTADGSAVVEAAATIAAEALESEAVPMGAETAVDSAAQSDDPSATDSGEAHEKVIETEDGKTRVVRVLAVGQEVTGTVKRVTEFGAFVDIGVGRDGLIHISELSIRRVGKVSDVLKQGQEITTWIKELDRERNRISLTLIPPGTMTIRDLEKDMLVEGTVTRILPYGAFIDIGVGRDALLHVREMGEGFVKSPEEVVKVGDKIEARIVELNKRRQRIDLSIKGLRPEPEPEPEPEPIPVASRPAQPEEELEEDSFENMEVLTPMELAFKRAMGDSGIELENGGQRGKRGKKARRRQQTRAIQDEIIARTLQSNRG